MWLHRASHGLHIVSYSLSCANCGTCSRRVPRNCWIERGDSCEDIPEKRSGGGNSCKDIPERSGGGGGGGSLEVWVTVPCRNQILVLNQPINGGQPISALANLKTNYFYCFLPLQCMEVHFCLQSIIPCFPPSP